MSTTAVELPSSCSVLSQITSFHHVSLGLLLAFDFHVFWPLPGATRPSDKKILLHNPAWTYCVQKCFFYNKAEKALALWYYYWNLRSCPSLDLFVLALILSVTATGYPFQGIPIGWQPLSLKMCDLCELRFIQRNVQKGKH